jgi:hypothetical protein
LHFIICIKFIIIIYNYNNDLNANKLTWASELLTFNENGDCNFTSDSKTILVIHLHEVYADVSICLVNHRYILHSNKLRSVQVLVGYAYY